MAPVEFEYDGRRIDLPEGVSLEVRVDPVTSDLLMDLTARAGVAVGELVDAIARVGEAFSTPRAQLLEAAHRLRSWGGRRRRSGHRHYGTRDWARRHGPGRPDLPLGQRARA